MLGTKMFYLNIYNGFYKIKLPTNCFKFKNIIVIVIYLRNFIIIIIFYFPWAKDAVYPSLAAASFSIKRVHYRSSRQQTARIWCTDHQSIPQILHYFSFRHLLNPLSSFPQRKGVIILMFRPFCRYHDVLPVLMC